MIKSIVLIISIFWVSFNDSYADAPFANEKKTYYEKFNQPINAAFLGGVRTFIGSIPEYPFEYMKTIMQTTPSLGFRDCFRETLREKGVVGFYEGWGWNTAKLTGRALIRFPLMDGLPPFYRDLFSWDKKEHRYLNQTLTAATIAGVESLLTPIERMRILKMTSENKTIKDVYKDFQGSIISELFRGNFISFQRQLMTLGSFLWTYEFYSAGIKNFTKKEILDMRESFLVGALIGITTPFLTSPFDTIKTNMQKHESYGSLSTIIENVMKNNMLYAGLPPKLIHSILRCGFSVPVLNWLKEHNKNTNKH